MPNEQKEPRTDQPNTYSMAIGISVGVVLEAGKGVAPEDPAIGLALRLAIGDARNDETKNR